jgi:beta-glucosidase
MLPEQNVLMKSDRPSGSKRLTKSPNGRGRSARPKATKLLPYKNSALPIEKRVRDLLARMTLEEKAAQMMCIWQKKAETLLDPDGNFDLEKAKASFKKGHGIGQVGRPSDAGKGKDPKENAELTNAIQKFFIEHSRLGIPVIFHEECLHGQASVGATSFSQPIGLAATFNPDLVRALFAMTAEEALTRHSSGADPSRRYRSRPALGPS